MKTKIALDSITRFEVIDETGRVYSNRPCTVQVSIQDKGRTMKVFVNKRSVEPPPIKD